MQIKYHLAYFAYYEVIHSKNANMDNMDKPKYWVKMSFKIFF